MKQTTHSVEINASAERVWQEVIDFDAYGEWNPVYTSFSGSPTLGSEVKMHIRPNNMKFSSKVSEAIPHRKLCWQGGMPLGMMTFIGGFDLESISDSKTRLTFTETLKGWLVPIFGGGMEKLSPVRDSMMQLFKERIEAV